MPKKITKETVASPFEKMFEASFQGMTPKQPEDTSAPDPEEKKPKKTTKRKTTKTQAPAYEAAKKEEKRIKRFSEGQTIEVQPLEEDPEEKPKTRYIEVETLENEKKPQPQTVTVKYVKGEKQQPQYVTVRPLEKEQDKQQKGTGRVFSVWLQEADVERLKTYTEATGRKMTDVVTAALNEYMNNHKLTEDQKAAYMKRLQDKTKNL